MRRRLYVGVSALLAALSTSARAGDDRHFEITPVVGAWIPLTNARHDFKTSPLSGLQVAAEIDPHVAFVGMFSWVPTDAKLLRTSSVDVLQYDLGVRLQQPVAAGRGVTLRPHLGAGYGLRALRFGDDRFPDSTNVGAFASTGLDASYRALAAGVTVRWDLLRTDGSAVASTYHALEVFASAGLRF